MGKHTVPELSTEPKAAAPRPPLVDLSSKTSAEFWQKMHQQDRLRDAVRAANPKMTSVYLECSEAGACRIDGGQTLGTPATRKEQRITAQVEAVVRTGSFKTSLRQTLDKEASLAFSLGDTQQTYDAPLLKEHNNQYWEAVSRPYEIQLIKDLAASNGTITHAALMKTALQVCNNDSQLAFLTLANFTKNIAGIERRQINPDQIDPSLRASYSTGTIDSIFHRIEGFGDNPSEIYNKEGAIYHFYGALFAGSQWGSVTNMIANVENIQQGINPTARTDRMKAAAGTLGAQIGSSWREEHESAVTWIGNYLRHLLPQPGGDQMTAAARTLGSKLGSALRKAENVRAHRPSWVPALELTNPNNHKTTR
jgi:hypothetical protein